MSNLNFDAREWNRKIKILGVAEEFGNISPNGYTAHLLQAIGLCRLTEQEHPAFFKVNRVYRKALSRWIKDFATYQEFSDGCWLLVQHYNTEHMLESSGEAELVELHRRWSSVIHLSLSYGNTYQIQNFVPFAQACLDDIVQGLLHIKRPKGEKQELPQYELDARQVKASINSLRVFSHYFPGMKKRGDSYITFCKWHADDPRGKPNLHIYADGHCHCFNCRAHYDVFGMIMSLDGVDYATAVATADRLGH